MKTVLIPLMILALFATTPLLANSDENVEDCMQLAQMDNISKNDLNDYMHQCIQDMEEEELNSEELQKLDADLGKEMYSKEYKPIDPCANMAQIENISKKNLDAYIKKCMLDLEQGYTIEDEEEPDDSKEEEEEEEPDDSKEEEK